MDQLINQRCVPCEGGMPGVDARDLPRLLTEVPAWKVTTQDGVARLQRRFQFDGFLPAIEFVNGMAQLAEQEGHHPNFCVNYSAVDVTIWTHAIGGLSQNDFILAAKLDRL